MKLFKTITLSAILCTVLLAESSAEILVRLSFKAILGPSGEWPNNAGGGFGAESLNYNSEAVVRENVAMSNRMLRDLGMGVQFVMVNNTVETVAGQSMPWFTADARCGDYEALRALIVTNATSQAAWKWNPNAINVYINDDASGCGGGDMITIGASAYSTLLIHEVLHCLGLGHTHGAAGEWVDGDGFSDTLPDLLDSSVAQVNAQHASQPQWLRDNLIFNIMSYHLPQNRLTWQQKRRVIETTNAGRSGNVSGVGRFVKQGGPNLLGGISWDLAAGMLSAGIANANPGDVLVINTGSWNANSNGFTGVLSKAMTLTALNGPVTITRN